MRRRLRRIGTAGGTTLAVLAVLVGSAQATIAPAPLPTAADPAASATPAATPTPTEASPAEPVPTEPVPTVTSPSPVPDRTTAPVQPVPSAPARREDPTPSPTGTTTSAPSPAAAPAVPLVPADGVEPAAGYTDEFLAVSQQRDTLALRVTELDVAAQRAAAVVVWYGEQRRSVQMTTAQAQAQVDSTQRSTDDVVRDLYQQGDAGLGSFATVLAEGPEAFLGRLDNARMATSTAYGVVDRSIVARRELAYALALQQAYEARTHVAERAALTAQESLRTAREELAALDARMVTLATLAPQVAIGPDGCPTADVPATLRDGAASIGAEALCRAAVRQAATPQAALALTWAFQHLGASYACKGVGRMLAWRADCSSLVSRAYHEGAGLSTAGDTWAPSTRDMVPWDGVPLNPHYAEVSPQALRPGDLVLYDTCPQGGCPYKHVVMYLGSPDAGKTQWMLHTNACGDIAKVTAFWGFPTTGHPFLVARRVVALPGETLRAVAPAAARLAAATAQREATAAVRRLGASVPG